MNCSELRSVLGLAHPTARPDRDAVRGHLRGCPRCARQHPEIALLLAAAPGQRTASALRPRRLAAAGVVLAALLVVPTAMDSLPPAETGPPAGPSAPLTAAAPPPRGRPVASHTTYTRTALTYHRGHAVSATLTCRQWAAEPARIPQESSD